MPKRRQHYVPQFYLRAFQSAPRRIHLYHLTSRKAIENASLRDQCYGHKFYGPTEEIEDSLAELEGAAAPVIQSICESGEPPAPGTKEHEILLAFVSLQIHRTPFMRQAFRDAFFKLDGQIFGDSDPSPESGLSRFSPISDEEVLRAQLKMLPQYMEALSDLQLIVARTGLRDRLITSDNPVLRYNSYCRGIRYWGVLGANSRGLQILFPLSPRVLLLLFDGDVYDVLGGALSGAVSIGGAEVEHLNAAQVVIAESCVYFSDWSHAGSADRLASAHLRYKQADVMRVNEGPIVGEENSSIVHSWEALPELPFSLPFSRLRWHARRIPLKERATAYRREWSAFSFE